VNANTAAPYLAERSWGALGVALRLLILLALVAIGVQSAIVVQARPQDLVTGVFGMADIIRRATPPDFASINLIWWPTLETIDIAIFGTWAASSWPCRWPFSPRST
jgi:ABC-type phosphate/phosphonate transport system permease subunit